MRIKKKKNGDAIQLSSVGDFKTDKTKLPYISKTAKDGGGGEYIAFYVCEY